MDKSKPVEKRKKRIDLYTLSLPRSRLDRSRGWTWSDTFCRCPIYNQHASDLPFTILKLNQWMRPPESTIQFKLIQFTFIWRRFQNARDRPLAFHHPGLSHREFPLGPAWSLDPHMRLKLPLSPGRASSCSSCFGWPPRPSPCFDRPPCLDHTDRISTHTFPHNAAVPLAMRLATRHRASRCGCACRSILG